MRKTIACLTLAMLLVTAISVLAKTTTAKTYVPTTTINVQPSTKTAILGEMFTVNVTIGDLSASDRTIGIQFRLQFDDKKLVVVSTTEGPFMKNPAWNFHGTYFTATVDNDPTYGPNVLVGVLLLPDSNGEWAVFPGGSGTLASITFNSILHPRDIPTPPLTTTLTLVNTLIVDYDLEEVPHELHNGTVEIYLPPHPTLAIQPSVTTAIFGAPFSVDIVVGNLFKGWRTIGLEFRMLYDDTMLQALNAKEGTFLKNPAWNLRGTLFLKSIDEDKAMYGPNVLVGAFLYPDNEGFWNKFPEGSGTIATLTFESLVGPPFGDPPLTSTLELINTLIINDDLEEIPHASTDGSVEIYTRPVMYVDPVVTDVPVVGSAFSLNVNIANLDSHLRAVGIQFRLQYDSTYLEVINVTEGPFLKNPAWNLHGTFFIPSVEVDPTYGPTVLVGDLLLPDDNGLWTAFPSGSGTLVTINFRAIHTVRGLENPPVIVELNLVNTLIIDDDLEEVAHSIGSGQCEIAPTNLGDINFDGKVDMRDIGLVARAFGSYPGHPRWNIAYDVNGDGKIDMRDVGIVARNFGWTP